MLLHKNDMLIIDCYEYEFLEERASKRGILAALDVYKINTKCVCYGSWRIMKMADRDGEKDELTEVLELFDHALLTGIRARTRLSRLCKSCLEMEWKVDDMILLP